MPVPCDQRKIEWVYHETVILAGPEKRMDFVHFGLVDNNALNFPISLSRIIFGYCGNPSWDLPFRLTQILT